MGFEWRPGIPQFFAGGRYLVHKYGYVTSLEISMNLICCDLHSRGKGDKP